MKPLDKEKVDKIFALIESLKADKDKRVLNSANIMEMLITRVDDLQDACDVEGFYKIRHYKENPYFPDQFIRHIRIIIGTSVFTIHVMQYVYGV